MVFGWIHIILYSDEVDIANAIDINLFSMKPIKTFYSDFTLGNIMWIEHATLSMEGHLKLSHF